MKKRIYKSLLLAAVLLPIFYTITQATEPDTLWTRDYWNDLNSGTPDYFEFHPSNDSIFIFTSIGRDSSGTSTGSRTVHFVNTITGQVFKKYAPIHEAHFTPDGKFLIGHNDSTIAYISLDSMKPVRTYPVLNRKIVHFTIDEKGKYAYSIFNYFDSVRNIGFYRWDIENGTVQKVFLPDSLLDIDWWPSCTTDMIIIENMHVSDTAKILLMQIFVDRPLPLCPAERRVWGIDLNADTVKYDFTKLHPTYTSSDLDKILPNRTQFIGGGWKYENNEKSGFNSVFDVATGAKIKDMLPGSYADYTISKDESFILTSDIVVYPNIQLNVFKFDNFDTVYIYYNVYTGPLTISPNNEFILQTESAWFVLYSTPWYPTSIIKQNDGSNDLLIYPNPTEEYIEIIVRAGSEPAPTESIRIYDILGMKVSAQPTSPLPLSLLGEGKIRLDISHLAPGIYFMRVGDRVQKFVKL